MRHTGAHLFSVTRLRKALTPVAGQSSYAPNLQDLLVSETSSGGRGGLNETGSHMMRQKVPGNEHFYFKDDQKTFCRLCQMEIRGTPKSHVYAPDKAIHSNHGCREIVLDSLAFLQRQGENIQNIQVVWSEVLLRCREFSRIPCLTGPYLTIHERAAKVVELLCTLRDIGVLDLSLSPAAIDTGNSTESQRRRVGFEMLECVGDNTWGSSMSGRMMLLFPDKQWLWSQCAHSFNTMRDAMEMNTNLELAYDLLDLGSVLHPAVRDKVGAGKIKADVLESILGELHKCWWEFEPQLYSTEFFVEVNGVGEADVASLAQHTISEMFDIIALSMLLELAVPAAPLASEVAASYLWMPMIPPVVKGRANKRTSKTVYLPTAGLHSTAVNPSTVSPLRPRLLSEITSEEGRDVFDNLKNVIRDLSKNKAAQPPEPIPQWDGLKQKLQVGGVIVDVDSSYDDVYFRDPLLEVSKEAKTTAPVADQHDSALTGAEHFLQVFPKLSSIREKVVESDADRAENANICPFIEATELAPGTKPPTLGVSLAKGISVGRYSYPVSVRQWKEMWGSTALFGTGATAAAAALARSSS